MGFIEHLVSGYMPGDCMPQDFIDHLTPGVPGFGAAITAVAAIIKYVAAVITAKRGRGANILL